MRRCLGPLLPTRLPAVAHSFQGRGAKALESGMALLLATDETTTGVNLVATVGVDGTPLLYKIKNNGHEAVHDQLLPQKTDMLLWEMSQ